MYDKDVTEHVLKIIADCSEKSMPADPGPETALAALSLDSLKMIQIIFEVETHFEIEIQEHYLFQIESIGDLILLIQRARAHAA